MSHTKCSGNRKGFNDVFIYYMLFIYSALRNVTAHLNTTVMSYNTLHADYSYIIHIKRVMLRMLKKITTTNILYLISAVDMVDN